MTTDYEKMLEWIEEESQRILEEESERWNDDLYSDKDKWICEYVEDHINSLRIPDEDPYGNSNDSYVEKLKENFEKEAEEQWTEFYENTMEQWKKEREAEIFAELKEEWINGGGIL